MADTKNGPAADCIENRTFDEIRVGESAELSRRLTMEDIRLFAAISGDLNPTHVDEDFAKSSSFHAVIANGMWGGALISALLGTKLPGPGSLYRAQDLRFHRPLRLGDDLHLRLTVREKHPEDRRLVLDCEGVNQNREEVISGRAEVIAAEEKIRRPRTSLPDVHLAERAHLHQLLEAAKRREPLQVAVVHPVDGPSLLGALEAHQARLIEPILVGPEARIRAAAEALEMDLAPYRLVPTEHSHEAAERAVALVRSGEAEVLMKGSLHTDELMGAVVAKDGGLRTDRRLSHVFAFDVPTYPRALFITDAAINIYPSLEDKRDIVQNAIDLAHGLGIRTPHVAILSAVETVTTKIHSTLEAAALCKMAERKQIKGGVLDGPLAFDNAVSEAAARTKGIESPVAGRADILVVPDLEAGNMLAKQLEYLAGAQGAGIVLGARVPVILTSRADDAITRMASCAIALLLVHHRRRALA
jgi:phosphate acetyltransferase